MVNSARVVQNIIDAFGASTRIETPFRYWLLADVFGEETIAALDVLPFHGAVTQDRSGTREKHNESRDYLDPENQAKFDVFAILAQAFQNSSVTKTISKIDNINLSGSFLRMEYAQDCNGFWLKPHTDIAEKLFSMIVYISPQEDNGLGTDIYADLGTVSGRVPFGPGKALAFRPSTDTYHGFIKRPIVGVRKSILVNYVSGNWKSRQQLAFPDNPIG